MSLKNDRLLRALRREPVDCTPIWLMRQAGRYLPEYRKVRAQAGGFMDLCTNPELACEVTLQPLERFDLDAAILFSDILTIPDAMGLGLYFSQGEGPRFERPLRDESAIDALGIPDPEDELGYVMDAVRTIRSALDGRVPLIGFAGSPWTLTTYMVEGASSKTYRYCKEMAWARPQLLEKLVTKLAHAVAIYLEAQWRAGAQALMVFDTWGGVLTPDHYRRFSLSPMQQIVTHLKNCKVDAPIILFSKDGGRSLPWLVETGCDALGVDWGVSMRTARELTSDRVALQGNLDPAALYGGPDAMRAAAKTVLDSYGSGPGHVFNLGHGLSPDMDPEAVGALVEAVHDLSREANQR